MSFWGEIRRRKVFQVAAVYAVVAWLLVQIVATVEEPLNLPDWFDTAVIVLLAVGFPITLIVSWAFNFTAEGLIRDQGGATPGHGRTIEYALIGLVIVAVGWLVFRVEFDGGVESDRGVLPDSIAVLPCENLSPDPDNAYFALGLHEEILNQLFKVRQLNVIARTSVMQYASVARPISEIAAELAVESVMECSVSYGDDRVAISAQLIDGETGIHLWSERYNREFSDIFGIQADIAMNVANALRVEFFADERERIERTPTASPRAYELYLEGLASSQTANYEEVIDLMSQAIELDDRFAEAWSAKSRALSTGFVGELEDTRMAMLAEAMEAAQRAIELVPSQSHGYAARGQARAIRHDWVGAEEDHLAALERGEANVPYGVFLLAVGRFDSARAELQRVLETDTRNPEARAFLTVGYELLRDFEAADTAYRQGKQLFPGQPWFGDVAWSWVYLGRGEAGPDYEVSVWLPELARLLKLTANDDRLVQLNRMASAPENQRPAQLANYAVWAAHFGDPEYALQLLDSAVSDTGSGMLMHLAWLPVFDEVRQLDGFRDLMRRIGIVDYWQVRGWPEICRSLGDDDFVCS